MCELNRHKEETGRKCFDALIELMKEMPLDNISASAILEKSKVSRSTFYRHYQDKYDLLNKSYDLILEDTLYTVLNGSSYRKSFYALYAALQQYPDFFKNAFSSTDHNCLRNYIFEQSLDVYIQMFAQNGLSTSDPYNQMMLHGFISGTLEITVQWALNGMKEPIEMIFKLCYELMPGEIKSLVSLYYM